MSVQVKAQRLSVADYLEAEKDSSVRHEFVDGQIYAMAGASDRHNHIAGNLYNRLDDHLGDGACEAFISDMKVWVSDVVLYYPDVVVACDGPARMHTTENNRGSSLRSACQVPNAQTALRSSWLIST